MRRENDAARMAGPMFHVEAGVVLRQIGVAAVAENAFDEIKIADEIARREETNFHRLLRRETRHFGANNRTQQHRHETLGGLRLRGGERQAHQRARGIEGQAEHFCERGFGHTDFVVGHRQSAFGDVKNSGGGAAVAPRIVQYALFDAIGVDDFGGKLVAIHRQRKRARHARAVQRESVERKFRHRHVLQIIVNETLDAPVGGAKVIGKETLLFAMLGDEHGNDALKFRAHARRHRREAEQRELDVDVGD